MRRRYLQTGGLRNALPGMLRLEPGEPHLVRCVVLVLVVSQSGLGGFGLKVGLALPRTIKSTGERGDVQVYAADSVVVLKMGISGGVVAAAALIATFGRRVSRAAARAHGRRRSSPAGGPTWDVAAAESSICSGSMAVSPPAARPREIELRTCRLRVDLSAASSLLYFSPLRSASGRPLQHRIRLLLA